METKEENWGNDPRRAPIPEAGEKIIFSECGRVLNEICYRSHYFRIVKPEIGPHRLIVKHGGGQEGFSLGYGDTVPSMIKALEKMDSNTRYLALYLMRDIHEDARFKAIRETSAKYCQAFLDKKLKKRKIRGTKSYRVEIKSW